MIAIILLILFIVGYIYSSKTKENRVIETESEVSESYKLYFENIKEIKNDYSYDYESAIAIENNKFAFLCDNIYVSDESIELHRKEHEQTCKNIYYAFQEPNKNPEGIFHGGCLSCVSQKEHGIGRCIGCQYFQADWSKPDLSIRND